MTTNLIQNYIANKPAGGYQANQTVKKQAVVQQTPPKPMPHFDIQHELDNRTFIKPLKGKGRLIKGNIFNAPAIMVKDAIYDAKALKHAIHGEANDHELGKLNDVGLKLGGLAIAGYLFTRKQTPLTKGMEFVGLGSFLASMAIWPKIAIQLPAYLIHGVNVQKQYEDSFGRKKPFYQDPQFIPWDLYTDEEIQKIGNRLGIDKNIPNRRDAIQEKMKKIAIQNNTLWMLTAGFATPVMSALICNQAEPYLAKYLNNIQNKKADKILAEFDKYAEKNKKHTFKNNLEKIIELYKDKPVDNELQKLLTNTFTDGMDLVTAESFKADLNSTLFDDTYLINDTTAKNISKKLKERFKNKHFDEEVMAKILPDDDTMLKLLKDNGFLNRNVEHSEFKKITDKVMLTIINNVNEYNKDMPADKQLDLTYIKKLVASNKKQNHPVRSVLDKIHGNVLDSTLQAKLRKVADIMDDFRAKNNALDEYALKKVGEAPETVAANYWNNTSKSLLDMLGITRKDINKVRFDRNLMGELVRDKIENIVSNKESYNTLMNKLAEKIAELDTLIKPSDISVPILKNTENLDDAQKLALKSNYEIKVDTVFNEFASALHDAGFHKTERAVVGINGSDNVGTLKNIQKAYVSDRLLGIKSSFLRLYNTIFYYRQIAENANDLEALSKYTREEKEEIIEFGKQFTISGHSSDFANKFYMHRNPHPSPDRSPLKVENGKVINEYFGKTKGLVDIPNDKYFYQDVMRMLFETGLDKDTEAISDKHLIKEEFMNYRKLILEKIGGENNFAKPRHRIRPVSDAGSELKFLLTGIATDELFFKAGQQAYNTNKWLKLFGTIGAATLGVTVLAQFFFGKMKSNEQKGSQK